MITITGATGNIGSKIAEKLLSSGQSVRCVARGREKLEALAAKGANVAAVDLEDTAALAEAFTGSQSVFTMIPPRYTAENFRIYQNLVGGSIAVALEKAGVKHVVNLSSQGADMSEGTGLIKGLHDQEKRLKMLEGANILHLRPTYFMENLLVFIDMIRNSNMAGSAIDGDLKLPMIAARDIADVAANRLLKMDFTGTTVMELLGQRDLSMNEATRIIGEKTGRPDLTYTRFSYEDTRKALVEGMGFSEDVAKLFVEMAKFFNDGLLKTPRTAGNTTPTTFEDFAEIFVKNLSERSD